MTPLKRILVDEGRRQKWLAERAGINEPALSRIVRGMHCDQATRESIARALGRTVGECFPEAPASEAA